MGHGLRGFERARAVTATRKVAKGFAHPAICYPQRIDCSRTIAPVNDTLILQVHDFEVMVLTGVYSEETHLPQPLRISLDVELDCPEHFAPDTPLSASKSYLDLKHAASAALPTGVHFTLIEGVADHIAETLLLQDRRVRRVTTKIIKLAIAEASESIGVTMTRYRR